jgi:hypothetical protein
MTRPQSFAVRQPPCPGGAPLKSGYPLRGRSDFSIDRLDSVPPTRTLPSGDRRLLSSESASQRYLSWLHSRSTSRRPGVYIALEIFSPSDQPQGLRRGFAFMGSAIAVEEFPYVLC